ncbi:MAG: hypothetical protein IPG92_16945 [Flavobacteriales bacterium]|nr:hypothetical protein [Flavobacteriales bacterium]
MEENGEVGYGEVTLPPYLTETVRDAIERLRSVASHGPWTGQTLYGSINHLPEFQEVGFGCRAGLTMALIDLISKSGQVAVGELLNISMVSEPVTLMTLGISPLEELSAKLGELPKSGALKVKVGDTGSIERIRALRTLDSRKFLLDGNQGLRSVQEAVDLVQAAGPERIMAFEQPFEGSMDELNHELFEETGVDVVADESVQTSGDLVAQRHMFNGVNIKLMKCGGLDRALALTELARTLDLKVMLGSMSESSLGCTAMAQLASIVDIVDLDGPWLIKNDPFEGIGMENGKIISRSDQGLGVNLRADLKFEYIGS